MRITAITGDPPLDGLASRSTGCPWDDQTVMATGRCSSMTTSLGGPQKGFDAGSILIDKRKILGAIKQKVHSWRGRRYVIWKPAAKHCVVHCHCCITCSPIAIYNNNSHGHRCTWCSRASCNNFSLPSGGCRVCGGRVERPGRAVRLPEVSRCWPQLLSVSTSFSKLPHHLPCPPRPQIKHFTCIVSIFSFTLHQLLLSRLKLPKRPTLSSSHFHRFFVLL